ncbi:MAG: DUF1211 domain-containing protein [Anaerolineaceae bacterium]|nr:DUF1211 domain-containing protein [Anaerolineaceae bacterium]
MASDSHQKREEVTHLMPTHKSNKLTLSDTDQDHVGLERIIFFSDAIFSIAVTLLVLEIRLPTNTHELTNEELLHDLLALWPKYLGYVLSFLIIGSFWLGHHRRFHFIQRYDAKLIFLNLVLLMFIAFIPFPTVIISEHGNQVGTIFYALMISATGVLSTSIWVYASRHHRLIDPAMPVSVIRRDTLRQLAVPAVFLVSVAVAFFNYELAKFCWMLIGPVVILIH